MRLPEELYRIRTRLLLANLLLVAIPIGGLAFARLFEDEALRALETDMIHQGQVLREVVAGGPPDWSSWQPLLERAASHTRTRIRLIDATGGLVADSHQKGPPEGPELPPPTLLGLDTRRRRGAGPPNPIENVGGRPEVQRALGGRYGATTRAYERAGVLFLFSALPVEKDGRVQGVVYLTRSTRPVLAALYRVRRGLVWLAIGAGASAVVISFLFAWTIARRLGRLERAAGRIAAGDRTATLDTAGRDEIAALARAFDAMTRKLDERARYIGDFAANVSHEFKSPLTSIRGAAELLAEGACDDDPGARARFLGNILGDADRLDRLVTRLLDLSRIEASPDVFEPVDWAELCGRAAERHERVALRYRAGRRTVRGNALHLESALGNLIDNALRYGPPDTPVELEVDDAPGGIVTRVRDHGPGISPANLPRVWDRFFSTDAAQGGTGLGLSIVASVARAHGGEVAVESTPGQGATFSLVLPV